MQEPNGPETQGRDSFVAYASRLQAILVIAAMFPLFPLVLLNLILLPGAPWFLRVMGVVIIAPVVIWLVVTMRLIFLREPVLEIDGRGILWRRWSGERIPWTAIERWSARGAVGMPYVTLWLREPERHPARTISRLVSHANRRLGFGHLTLSTGGTNRTMPELIAAVRAYAPELPIRAGT